MAPSAQPLEGSENTERLLERVRELEAEVQEWRRRAEVAEARAEEHHRALDAFQIANKTERMALRMLTGQSSRTTPEPAAPAPEPEPAPESLAPRHQPEPRRGFFSRIFSV
ncbi:hypothetical protein KVA01_11200 [Kocuria varians]|uniref:Uncharacterized protein n=1 Tax=Kocuria varians TaxID=1272 RepID=A0A4Y4D1A9_KOCVA|nr:hypothetical protein KVA01_11200 [Kocuria varians]